MEKPVVSQGATIRSGVTNWQIVQADEDGFGTIQLTGSWAWQSSGCVEVRLVSEETSTPVTRSLDWHPAVTLADGSWSMMLENIPAGGLYRLETRFNCAENPQSEWSPRGEMRHFIGVGDLWVIAGQSNSAGYGRGPVNDPPELGIHMFRNSMEWMLASHPLNDSTQTKHAENQEYSNPGHSPYLHFARQIKKQLGYPIGLIQTSLGGSSLAQWNPTDPDSPAILFHNMVRCVAAVGGKVKGILWYQGESDANPESGQSYKDRFERAVHAWREALGQPDLPVLTVQLNRLYTPSTEDLELGWSYLREAQRLAAKTIPGVHIIPTLDLPLSDGVHNSPAGNLLMAERLAQTALGAVYAFPVDYLAPEIHNAVLTGDKKIVELCFSQVTSRIDNIDPTANCFKVEDSYGVVPIEKVIYTGSAKIQLALGRAFRGKGTVHGGYGITPASVPIDVERFLPMLAFYAMEVQAA